MADTKENFQWHIVDDIVDGTHKTQGHETEVIPVSGLKAALDKYKTDVVDDGLSGKQDTISDLATIRSGASAGATAVQPSALATVATSGSYNDLSNKPVVASTTTCESIIDELT